MISSRFPSWYVVILPLDEDFIFHFLRMRSTGNFCRGVMLAFLFDVLARMVVLEWERSY